MLTLRRLVKSLEVRRRAHPVRFWVQTLAVALTAALFLLVRAFWLPDTLFVVLLVPALAFGKAREFLHRFVPFIGLLVVYDSFRSIADDLNRSVHFLVMPDFDKFVFDGVLPTEWLQRSWWVGHASWYDFYFFSLYSFHFLAPILMALLIWWRRSDLYWPYVWAFVVLSFAAFVTFLLFPAAPPWLAAKKGYIQPLHYIVGEVWRAMGMRKYTEIYRHMSPNKVAAVPSLHAAYPALMVLFAARAFGWRRTWWLALYPISIWVGIVYLGEHYVFDVVLGVAYAAATYQVVSWLSLSKREPEYGPVPDTYPLDERARATLGSSLGEPGARPELTRG